MQITVQGPQSREVGDGFRGSPARGDEHSEDDDLQSLPGVVHDVNESGHPDGSPMSWTMRGHGGLGLRSLLSGSGRRTPQSVRPTPRPNARSAWTAPRRVEDGRGVSGGRSSPSTPVSTRPPARRPDL